MGRKPGRIQPKLDEHQQKIIMNLRGMSSPYTLVIDQLIYIAYELAMMHSGVLDKKDFYAVSRTLLSDALTNSSIKHNNLYTAVCYGLGLGISIKGIEEITIPSEYLKDGLEGFKEQVTGWRLNYQRVQSADSIERRHGSEHQCKFDSMVLEAIFALLREILSVLRGADARINTLEDLQTDFFLSHKPSDFQANETYHRLEKAYKEARREIAEKDVLIARLQTPERKDVLDKLAMAECNLEEIELAIQAVVSKTTELDNNLRSLRK